MKPIGKYILLQEIKEEIQEEIQEEKKLEEPLTLKEEVKD